MLKAGLNKWEEVVEASLTQPQELQGLPGCWLLASLQLPKVQQHLGLIWL